MKCFLQFCSRNLSLYKEKEARERFFEWMFLSLRKRKMVVLDRIFLNYLYIIKWLVLQNLWFWINTCCKYQFFLRQKIVVQV